MTTIYWTVLARSFEARGKVTVWGDTHYRLNVGRLTVGSDADRLNQELVATLVVGRGVTLHRLQENCRSAVIRTISHHRSDNTEGVPCTSTSFPDSMRPELGRTQYLFVARGQ